MANFELKLKGKTLVLIDWANVYGWTKSLKKEVDPKALLGYLKTYPEIEKVNFYYGLDKNQKSEAFLTDIADMGYSVVSKEVKYIPIYLDSSHFGKLAREVKDSLQSIASLKTEDIEKILQILSRKVLRRKCDFDMEIALDCFKDMDKYKSFIFFSGDGDFEPLYRLLGGHKKQVIVIYAPGHLGKEVWDLKRVIFKTEVGNFPVLKNVPPISRGA